MSEKKILKNIRSGQQDSIDIMIEKYYKDVYIYCCCRVGDVQTAQDLTQEVFLKFLQNLDSYEHTGKLKNYLYVIAGNLIKDYYKKHKDLSLEDMQEEKGTASGNREWQLPESNGAAAGADISEKLTLQDIIRSLPQTERELILLRYYQNMRLSQIAQILSMPVSTVRYRMRKAEEYIRERWEE